MKSIKSIVFIGFIVLFALLFGTNSIASTAIVDTDTLKLREEASTDSTTLELLNLGEKMEVLDETEEWAKVKINGMTGYVYKEYIKIDEETQTEIEEKTEVKEEQEESVEPQKQEEPVIKEETTKTETRKEKSNFQVKEVTLKNEVDVYILPLINATKIDKLSANEEVTLISETNNWVYVEAEKFNGWIIKKFIDAEEVVKEEQTEPEKQEENQNTTNNEEEVKTQDVEIDKKAMYVNYSSIYVREEPSTSAEVVDTLILNNQVMVIAESGDWYKVEVDGKQGYIAKRLLSNTIQEDDEVSRGAEERTLNIQGQTNTEEEQKEIDNAVSTSKNNTIGEEIAEFAQEYLGCPYVYGGSGPSSFDCSGFTMFVYQNFGIYLSHSATAQSRNGEYVAKEDLEPGDLVFFKDYETMDGIGHVGIYIGDGDFIHASSGTGYCVKISTLLSGSYDNRYETARRLV